jgi:O-acetyl-ADP-ribose deacetylase (regulator of RNase III)
MIERGAGSLLDARVDALVNPVNTAGAMGRGLALQFKHAYPAVYADYARACREGAVAIGRVYVVDRPEPPRFIIHFPTKQHWRGTAKLAYIEAGLVDLVATVHELAIRSIGIPPLGCGLGGLAWSDVRPRIVDAFAALPEVRVVLFEPDELLPRRSGRRRSAAGGLRPRASGRPDRR